jgi:hypothetical protein
MFAPNVPKLRVYHEFTIQSDHASTGNGPVRNSQGRQVSASMAKKKPTKLHVGAAIQVKPGVALPENRT